LAFNKVEGALEWPKKGCFREQKIINKRTRKSLLFCPKKNFLQAGGRRVFEIETGR